MSLYISSCGTDTRKVFRSTLALGKKDTMTTSNASATFQSNQTKNLGQQPFPTTTQGVFTPSTTYLWIELAWHLTYATEKFLTEPSRALKQIERPIKKERPKSRFSFWVCVNDVSPTGKSLFKVLETSSNPKKWVTLFLPIMWYQNLMLRL